MRGETPSPQVYSSGSRLENFVRHRETTENSAGVVTFAKDTLDDVFYHTQPDEYGLPPRAPVHFLENKIAELMGDEEWSEGIIGNKLKEGSRIFFLELADFVKAKQKEDPQATETFLNNLREKFFSRSPSLINCLGTDSMLEFAAKTTRQLETQQIVGFEMLGEVVEAFSSKDSDHLIEKMNEKILTSSVGLQLDYIRVFENLSSYALSNDRFAAEQNIQKILELLKQKSAFPLVKYSAQLLQERLSILARQIEAPQARSTQSRKQFENSTEYVDRVQTETARQNDALKFYNIQLSEPLKFGQTLMAVSKDCVGVIDKNGLLISMAPVHLEQEVGSEAQVVTMQRVEDVMVDSPYIAFQHQIKDETEEKVVLFQSMHHPELRNMIEQEFGFSYAELSRRGQMHWLEFLSHQDDGTLERLKSILHSQKVEKNNFLETYLACATDATIGQDILHFAETQEQEMVETVLRDYKQIVEFADVFAEYVIPEIEKRTGRNINAQEFLHDLLKRGTKFLHFVFDAAQSETNYTNILEILQKQRPGLSLENCMQGVVAEAVIHLVNIVGDTETRSILNQMYMHGDNASLKQAADLGFSFITPVTKDAAAIRDLKDFYNSAIRFEEYKVNQEMNEKEIAFLQGFLSEDDQILDLGCGTGRLLLPLAQKYHVSGIDLSERHVEIIQGENPKVPVTKGDWKHTPFQTATFDTVYSLGRNILHENQLVGQRELFLEANRVLKPGGKFIIDIPDRNQGGYKMLTDHYAEVMHERGIERFREGTIYDSPDGVHFDTRYAYSHEDIVELAEYAGFVVEKKEERSLATGKYDVNVYYILKKVKNLMAQQMEEGLFALAA